MTVVVEAHALARGEDAAGIAISPDAFVVARSRSHLPHAIRDRIPIAHDYDAWLDTPVGVETPGRIANDILRLARERGISTVAYLLGPAGAIADETVRHLAMTCTVRQRGGSLPATGGPTIVVDALALASAAAARPFDAGLVPLDPAAATIVTNWCGEGVVGPAANYLRARLGLETVPEPDDDGTLVVQPATGAGGQGSLAGLRQIYARLRRPDGCPWDREQSEATTLGYIAEEVDELREALAAGAWPDAADELGDILGNVVMIAQIAEESGRFTLEDAVSALSEKLVRRHPHVFGEEQAATPDEVLAIWNRVKRQENAETQRGGSTPA